jgi:hypothetical protein
MTTTTMWRKTTCNGCGYTQTTITSYYLDRKQWKANHSLDAHKSRKAFNEMLGNPLGALDKLSVIKTL